MQMLYAVRLELITIIDGKSTEAFTHSWSLSNTGVDDIGIKTPDDKYIAVDIKATQLTTAHLLRIKHGYGGREPGIPVLLVTRMAPTTVAAVELLRILPSVVHVTVREEVDQPALTEAVRKVLQLTSNQ